MTGFHHILFPVDFSERCRAVRPFIKSMAQATGAKVTLLNAIQLPQGIYGGVDVAYPIVLDVDAMKRDAEEQMATLFQGPDDSLPAGVKTTVVVGEAVPEIIRFAEKNGVDLIMIPTHGYGRFRSLLLGSVAAKVLHDAFCPVWTAAHIEDLNLPGHAKCESMLCAVDLMADSVPLVRRSVELAGMFNAKLRLVHAVPTAEPGSRWFDDDFRRSMLEWAREEIAKLQKETGTNLEVCLDSGSVSKVVHAAALHHNADLIVIGRGKLHETLGRLRTNTYAIVRDSPCPVLSL